MQPFATQALLGNAMAEASAFVGETSTVLPTWNTTDVNPADQLTFERSLGGATVPVGQPSAIDSSSSYKIAAAASSSTNLGESILNSLAGVKQRGEAIQAEMLQTLSKSDLSSGDLLSVQYKLMSLSIELQTTSNMAHHGVEDVKTIMRGQ